MLDHLDFPGGSDGKASSYNAGGPGSIPGSGRIPWRRQCHPTPAFLPGESHGWRSLVGYSPWGRKESDMTERLHFHFPPFHQKKILLGIVYTIHYSPSSISSLNYVKGLDISTVTRWINCGRNLL